MFFFLFFDEQERIRLKNAKKEMKNNVFDWGMGRKKIMYKFYQKIDYSYHIYNCKKNIEIYNILVDIFAVCENENVCWW